MSGDEFEGSTDKKISERMHTLGATGAEALMQVAHEEIVEGEHMPIVDEQLTASEAKVGSVCTDVSETPVQEQVGLREEENTNMTTFELREELRQCREQLSKVEAALLNSKQDEQSPPESS